MNAEQKQRAAELISRWNKDYPEFVGDRMAALLQEMVDAPEVLAATNPAQISSSAEPSADVARDAERYRWLRIHGLQRAWVSLGTDFEGDNFASFRCEFNVPEPPNLPYEDDEGLQWADKDFDAAIDAAIKRQGGQP